MSSNSWCWTLNNWTHDDLAILKNADTKYIIWGKEIAPTTLTPHLQGFTLLHQKTTMKRAKEILGIPRMHLEPRRGTTQQAIDYCKKDGLWEDHGAINIIQPNTLKDQWGEVIALAENGMMDTIKDQYPRLYLTYFKTLMSIKAYKNVPLQGELQHEWWYGPTGTGKSRQAWDLYPDHYSKAVNKWWDGYYGQEVVVIEEWEPKNEMTASKLKIWADRYPFPAEIKGGTLQRVRPTKIIVTSNYTIDECFPNPQDAEPLKRRFKVMHFPRMFQTRWAFPLPTTQEEEEQESEDLAAFLRDMN